MLEDIAYKNRIKITEWWEGTIIDNKVVFIKKSNKGNRMQIKRWKYIPLQAFCEWNGVKGYKRVGKQGRYTSIGLENGYEAYPKPWSRVKVIDIATFDSTSAKVTVDTSFQQTGPGVMDRPYYPPYESLLLKEDTYDPINKPIHYNTHPSGVEPITITEHMNFCLGNVIKYVMRAGLKDKTKELEDLKKAQFYLNREITRRENEA